ncbi:MAG: GTP-binding protein, partial [Steroidobacteraceae bacterium]|nr:GTP-binding protein [Steroidobacteraceae bacterium]
IGAEEEIVETNNGCLCCTVRGDLVRILNQLLKRRDRFDYVLIETTGMADPGPVVQTFFVDEDLKAQFYVDAIVTVVDAHHFERHADTLYEPLRQVAFADVVLLNKIDLADAATLSRTERRIRAINSAARVHRTRNADIAIDQVLGLGAFDLDRALAVDHGFLEPQQPFEWAGIYQLPAGRHRLVNTTGDATGHGHDHAHSDAHDHGAHPQHDGLGVALLDAPAASADGLTACIEPAVRAFEGAAQTLRCGAQSATVPGFYRADLAHPGAAVEFTLPAAGLVGVFLEHAPDEFALRLTGYEPVVQRSFASHHHAAGIGSIGISAPGELLPNKVNDWLSYLLQSRGPDIFRMKGVLNFKGEARRYVFHGVHMMFDGRLERPWGTAPRHNRLVFIGRGLDRRELEAGFESCKA